MKGVYDYLKSRGFKGSYRFNIVLISKEIDTTSDYIFLTDFINSDESHCLNSLKNYSFTYNVDGIIFKYESSYSLIDKGF